MRILAFGGIRRGMGVIGPTAVPVATVQCGINRMGGNVDVDGYFGPQTRANLLALAGSFQLAGGDAVAFDDPGDDATRIVLAARFHAWLVGGTLCDRETGPSGGGSSRPASTPVVRLSAPFWRRDNWKAWAVAALLAAGLGVGGAYVATKPKRKRSKS